MSERKSQFDCTYMVSYNTSKYDPGMTFGTVNVTIHWTKEQRAWASWAKLDHLVDYVAKLLKMDKKDFAIANIVNLDAVL